VGLDTRIPIDRVIDMDKTTATRTVDVFINRGDLSEKFFGYKPGDPLQRAATFIPRDGDPLAACEEAFHLFNAPIEYLAVEERQVAEDYHRLYPSLSVGDVVAVTDGRTVQFYACASFGWDLLTDEPNIRPA